MDIAVLVNLRARRASERVLRAVRRAMPEARLVSTRSIDDALDAASALRRDPPDLLVSGGGDGTAVTLLTALRGPAVPGTPAAVTPPLALLPLGTGNGWAHAVGTPRWRTVLSRLGRLSGEGGALPLRRFDLLEVDGVLCPFAGAGWDSRILEDYRAIKNSVLLPRPLREGAPGYALSVLTRSIPRALWSPGPVEVELTNLGEPAIGIGPDGRPVRIAGAGPGTVLYRGPMSVCGCGTTPHLGFGFKAFPFVGAVAGRFAARVYTGPVLEAVRRVRQLYRGDHPLPHDHQFLLTHCRMSFSRPLAFQVGGDVQALRSEVELRLAGGAVELFDFRADARPALAA